MKTIRFQIHVLLQQKKKKKKKKTALFSNDFPVNTLTHLCTKDFNFRACCRLRKSEIMNINISHLGKKKHNKNGNI